MRLTLLLLALAACAAPAPQPMQGDDWDAVAKESVSLLQQLIRIDTINPPQPGSPKKNADETALLKFVQAELKKDGIDSEIFESAPGRGNLVARLKGATPGKGLLMMAHVDVVNVDPSKWLVDPMSGEIKDGFLWGRGALDDKGGAVCFLQAMRLVKRRNLQLKRDLVLMLNADEESSGRFGAEFMVRNHWDKIDCDAAINEGGRCRLEKGKVASVNIQTAEKIYNDIKLWVRGESGHSSVPRKNNAIYSMARFLAALEPRSFPVKATPTVTQFLDGIAPKEKDEVAALIRKISAGDPKAADELAAKEPRFNALLRSTFVPTIAAGGIRENVLPPDILVNLNLRLLPGEKLDDAIKSICVWAGIERYAVVEPPAGKEWEPAWKTWLADQEKLRREGKSHALYDVAVVVADRGLDAPASPLDNAVYGAIRAAAKVMWPDAVITPMMSTGATDSRFFRAKGVPCYGMLPLPVSPEDGDSVHNHNERVAVSSVGEGVKMAWEIVEAWNR
jgi:acetylornithine deacetylase/succinyl-diaminopimelate desuccinylase-like protein